MAPMLPVSEACERNKEPILAVLRDAFAARHAVLEIGSGTGQHAVHFAAALGHLDWQPTERAENLPGLSERVTQSGLPNLRLPIELDVTQPQWPATRVDGIFTANTLHIMAWHEVVAMFEGIARVLMPAGTLAVYGPFSYDGRHTSPSNERFDRFLRARDPDSGIRDLTAVRTLAGTHGLVQGQDHDLPANNRLVIFQLAP